MSICRQAGGKGRADHAAADNNDVDYFVLFGIGGGIVLRICRFRVHGKRPR